ncbi:MAG: methionine synthase [Acutalibacteraceae bacterium]|jgi:hypothetical protein
MSEIYEIDRAEVLRYLHCTTEDDSTRALLDRCLLEVRQAANPRAVCRVFDLDCVGPEFVAFAGTGLRIPGSDLQRHLNGCRRAVLLAVTLGEGVDRAIRTAQIVDMARAVVLDCCASAMVESVCNAEEGRLRGEAVLRGEFLTSRFSPGYGDVPLAVQKDFLAVLEAGKRIGLSASAENLLIPRKSVTAVLGLADYPVTGALAGCRTCALRGKCEFRRRGTTCFTE